MIPAEQPLLPDFTGWYEQIYPQVFRFMYAGVHDGKLAEDLTHETLLRINPHWSKWSEANWKPQTFLTARRLLIDHWRRQPQLPDAALDDELPGNGIIPGSAQHLQQMDVLELMQKLSPRYQEVIALRLSGLTNIEVAEVLNISQKAASMAFKRAIERLKEMMDR